MPSFSQTGRYDTVELLLIDYSYNGIINILDLVFL